MNNARAIGVSVPPHKLDRWGNVLAAGLWIGDGCRFILLECAACQSEQVVSRWQPWRVSHELRTRIRRDGERVELVDEHVERIERVGSRCLECGRSLNVLLCGRLHEPWPWGAGVVVPMSEAWRELHDGEAGQ